MKISREFQLFSEAKVNTCLHETEREAWDEDDNTYLQASNAWVDDSCYIKWAEKTLKSVAEKGKSFVLFCYNIERQKADFFRDFLKELVGGLFATDTWKSINAGYDQLLKILIKQETFKRFDDDSSIEIWYCKAIFTDLKNAFG